MALAYNKGMTTNTYPILGRLDGLPHQPPIKIVPRIVEFREEKIMNTKRVDYKGHDIRVTRFFDGLKNALFIDGKFTGDAGFSSFEAALAYGERLVDEA